MSQRPTKPGKRSRLVLLVFAASLALTAFFIVRMIVFTAHWSDPQNRDLAIEGWMPLRYVARSWDVPPEVLGQALELTPGARMTVADIATARSTDVATIRAQLMAAIAAWRAEHADND